MVDQTVDGKQCYAYGYPETCSRCAALGDAQLSLGVKPFFKPGGAFRLMLVGQDPTVRKAPERVHHVLMLDQPNGQLSRWLRGILGEVYDTATIYATNVVKCSFARTPSDMEPGGLPFLSPYADKCKPYLVDEVRRYRPALVLTLGEPAHIIFRSLLDNPEEIGEQMKNAFGKFVAVTIGGVPFDYSPCLHIQTFRVAETYGPLVHGFKTELNAALRMADREGHGAVDAS